MKISYIKNLLDQYAPDYYLGGLIPARFLYNKDESLLRDFYYNLPWIESDRPLSSEEHYHFIKIIFSKSARANDLLMFKLLREYFKPIFQSIFSMCCEESFFTLKNFKIISRHRYPEHLALNVMSLVGTTLNGNVLDEGKDEVMLSQSSRICFFTNAQAKRNESENFNSVEMSAYRAS